MLAFARHGATTSNEAGLLVGASQLGLSDLGRLQSKRLAQWAKTQEFSQILSSDFVRAKETAEIISAHLNIPVSFHAELRERNYKKYDHIDRANLIKMRTAAGHCFVDPTQDWISVADVESDHDVYSRTLDLIRLKYPPSCTANVLVVTHAGTIKSFLHETFAIEPNRSNCFKVPNGSVLVFNYDSGCNLQLFGFYPKV